MAGGKPAPFHKAFPLDGALSLDLDWQRAFREQLEVVAATHTIPMDLLSAGPRWPYWRTFGRQVFQVASPRREPEYISFEIHRRVIFPALDEIDVFDEAPTAPQVYGQPWSPKPAEPPHD